ncbi:MAG: ABC transporter permease [Candidatus Hydrogenedentes bacterium]|nr:ABC transporter permease [Candidatus Hydrogenedentota bacterium]
MSEKRIQCPPTLDEDSGRGLFQACRAGGVGAGDALVLDFADTQAMDARGGAWLVEIAGWARARDAAFHCEHQRGDVGEFLSLIAPGLAASAGVRRARAGILERIGDVAWRFCAETREMLNLVVDAVYWTVLAPFEGRGFRWGWFVDEMHEMGVRAVQINLLMNFLLGLTIAMLSAAQLRTLGLDIYVANLVIIGFARELAAIMTAVVVAARTGAAIAAELSTMKVQEEIDALRGMGLKVPQFLVAPKLLALVIVMPCLTILGLLAGIAGGTLWGTLVLGYRLDLWVNQTLGAAAYDDLAQGLLKSLFFAVVIVLVGCHNGLRVEGGSRGVGLMTTRAVVMDVFFIIVIDMAFAGIFYYVLD